MRLQVLGVVRDEVSLYVFAMQQLIVVGGVEAILGGYRKLEN